MVSSPDVTAILGINAYHPDASAVLLCDGKIVAAVAEERLGERIKHCTGFPGQAIQTVLKLGGLRLGDVDHVALGQDNNANKKQKIAYSLSHPINSARVATAHIWRRRQMHSLHKQLAGTCGVDVSEARFQLHHVEHHLAHVASAFFASPFERAAGFSYDGSGDFASSMYARCEGNRIEPFDRVYVPHSLGFFYTSICQFIGFDTFGDEYKVMGLSAYGNPVYLDVMRKLLRTNGQGRFWLAKRYFNPFGGRAFGANIGRRIWLPNLYDDRLIELFGLPRKRGEEITQRDKDLAASCQKRFEEAVLECVRWLHKQVGGQNIVTAGGCALNGVCNARVPLDTPFANYYIQPAASDDGTALGAALYVWNAVLNQPRIEPMDHAFLGPEHSVEAMEQALKDKALNYQRFDEPALLDRVATHLAGGHVTGWYQGRSEWGPRALGNRSILAHPGWPGMKDLINAKIKRREPFRPFAPTILREEVANYFEHAMESPFMMHVVKIRPEKRQALAAVCHEDSTGRLHSVSRSQNRLYYDLIKTFAAKTQLPVVLNTSFNENEPIVDSPAQAVECFVRTDMDVLCLGPFVTVKPNIPAGN